MSLTSDQITTLSGDVAAGDRISYYHHLSEFGYIYGGLALGVVNNDTVSGATANIFMSEQAGVGITVSTDLMATVGLELMQADFDARLTSGNLGWREIQSYHNSVFVSLGIRADAWTPNIALNNQQTDGQREAIWYALEHTGPVGGFTAILVNSVQTINDDGTTAVYLLDLTSAGTRGGAFGQTPVSVSNYFGGYRVGLR